MPPKLVILSDSEGVKLPGAAATVNEGIPHAFTCMVLGTRPAATIQWFLDSSDVPQSTTIPPVGGSDLVNTTNNWLIMPERSHHRQKMKCVASTAESVQPYPFVEVTLNVNGMYIYVLAVVDSAFGLKTQ